MGRQSARLIYQGKDHKDIYYNGHYHDAMYWSDNEGNVTLVWEKLKGTLVKNISMLSYVNGKYYAVVESADYMYQESYPVLYEGTSLSRMHEKGKIFGDGPVRGGYFIMYAGSDELTIIRTYNISERHIARIPINKNGADMENILYNIENNIYRFANYVTAYHQYFYGNGNNEYYYDRDERAFFKNDNKIRENINHIINVNDKLISIGSVTYNTSTFEGYLQFDVFNENEEFEKHSISLAKILENAREIFTDERNWNAYQASGITLVNIVRVSIGYYGIAMISNSDGYILIDVRLRNVVGRYTYNFQRYYKLKINFDNFTLLEAKAVTSYDDYTFNSYMIESNKYRVQIGAKKTAGGVRYTDGISYGLIDNDYENDVFIEVYSISNIPNYIRDSLSTYRVCSLAYNNDILIVKISNGVATEYGFIIIDTKTKTAKYSEIDMYAD